MEEFERSYLKVMLHSPIVRRLKDGGVWKELPTSHVAFSYCEEAEGWRSLKGATYKSCYILLLWGSWRMEEFERSYLQVMLHSPIVRKLKDGGVWKELPTSHVAFSYCEEAEGWKSLKGATSNSCCVLLLWGSWRMEEFERSYLKVMLHSPIVRKLKDGGVWKELPTSHVVFSYCEEAEGWRSLKGATSKSCCILLLWGSWKMEEFERSYLQAMLYSPIVRKPKDGGVWKELPTSHVAFSYCEEAEGWRSLKGATSKSCCILLLWGSWKMEEFERSYLQAMLHSPIVRKLKDGGVWKELPTSHVAFSYCEEVERWRSLKGATYKPCCILLLWGSRRMEEFERSYLQVMLHSPIVRKLKDGGVWKELPTSHVAFSYCEEAEGWRSLKGATYKPCCILLLWGSWKMEEFERSYLQAMLYSPIVRKPKDGGVWKELPTSHVAFSYCEEAEGWRSLKRAPTSHVAFSYCEEAEGWRSLKRANVSKSCRTLLLCWSCTMEEWKPCCIGGQPVSKLSYK